MSTEILTLNNICNTNFFDVANIIKKDPTHYDKKIANVKNETPLHWHIVAIAVGSLVVLGVGGFGILGLLNSYGIASLPQALSSAIGTIGNTSHFWSLWLITAGGIAIGGLFIAYNSIKLHSSHETRKRNVELVQKNIELYHKGMQVFWGCFSLENVKKLEISEKFRLKNGQYTLIKLSDYDQYAWIIKNNNQLQCTQALTSEECDFMERFFKECPTGYIRD